MVQTRMRHALTLGGVGGFSGAPTSALPNLALECAMKRDLGMDEGLWQQSR